MPPAALITLRHGECLLVEVALPGRPLVPAGVILFDPAAGMVDLKLRSDWSDIAEEDDVEVLERLEEDLKAKCREMPAGVFLADLEDKLSNVVRIGERRSVTFRDFDRKLQRLFAEHLEPEVPWLTLLPQYSLRAAATYFGEDMEVETAEAEAWVRVSGLRLTRDMFVAHVVGRSMEPLIPDGSLCVFRHSVVGTRQGKLLLIRQLGASQSGGEFTIKRYHSTKRETEEGWEHATIRLEPLNPEFDAWELTPDRFNERFRVIGEFLRVLEDE